MIIKIVLVASMLSIAGLYIFNAILSRNARLEREAKEMEDMIERYCLREEVGYTTIFMGGDDTTMDN